MQEATLPRAKVLPCLSVRFEYSNGTSDQALKVRLPYTLGIRIHEKEWRGR